MSKARQLADLLSTGGLIGAEPADATILKDADIGVTVQAYNANLASLISPAFTGTPTTPTAATATNNTQIASTNFVRNAITTYASTTYGAIGTYVFGYRLSTGVVNGSTYAGSSIQPAGQYVSSTYLANDTSSAASSITKGGSALSGTWRAMGRASVDSRFTRTRSTLFVRIS